MSASVDNVTGHLQLTSDSTGTQSSVALWDNSGGALALLGLAEGMSIGSGHNTMVVSVDGGAAQTISVAAGTYKAASNGSHDAHDIVDAVQAGLTAKSIAATASVDGSGKLVITSNTSGTSSNVTISDDATNPGLMGQLGLAAGSHDGNSPRHMLVSVDGGPGTLVTVAAGTYTAAAAAAHAGGVDDIITKVQAGLTGAGLAATASVDALTGKLVITSNSTGSSSSVSVSEDTTDPGLVTALGLDTVNHQVGADGATADAIATQIQTQMNTQLAGTGASAKVTVANSQIVITNNALGAGTNNVISAVTGNATTALNGNAWAAGLFTANVGVNRSGSDLANAISQELAGNATLAAAGLTASWDSTNKEIAITGTTAFRMNAGAAPAQGTVTGTADLTQGADFSSSPMTLKIAADGGAAKTVTLTQKYTSAAAVALEISNQLAAAGSTATATAVAINGKTYVQLKSTTVGTAGSVQVGSNGTANATLGLTDNTVEANSAQVNIGFGVSNSTSTGALGLAKANSSLNVVNAGGSSQTGALSFQGLTAAGAKTQALTLSANDNAGAMQSTTITLAATGQGLPSLANDGSGDDIDKAVTYINSQLQHTNNATLQSIVAVKQTVGGSEEVNFISSMSNFQVGIGSASGNEGLNAGMATAAKGLQTGSGSTVSVLTQSDALAAVNAVSQAVSKLGTAQAAIGKGQNQLNYAVNLAQSQIANFSAAESRIRDADVASEAANLTKASVLQQASIAAMAQANSAPQAVLSLLKG